MQYKKEDKQVNRQQQLCKDKRNKIHNKQLVYINRDFAKKFSYKCIHQTADSCDIKGKTEHATWFQLEFDRSCVKRTSGLSRIQSALCGSGFS